MIGSFDLLSCSSKEPSKTIRIKPIVAITSNIGLKFGTAKCKEFTNF